MPFGRGPTRWIAVGLLLIFSLAYLYKIRQTDVSDSPIIDEYDETVTKHLVVVTTKEKRNSTAWVHDELADWPSTIYVADDPNAPDHPAQNKGNEANMYLQWIIEHYAVLPDVTVFVHDHNHAFHVDAALGSNANSLRRLRLGRVLRKGYQSLRCAHEIHCVLRTVEFYNTARNNWGFDDMWDTAVQPNGGGPKPKTMVAPCCAQFAVSADAIRRRPVAMYEALHRWLMGTALSDAMAGRILEYSWHAIFGMKHVLCPDQDKCYCETYGLCDKNSSRGLNEELANTDFTKIFKETISE